MLNLMMQMRMMQRASVETNLTVTICTESNITCPKVVQNLLFYIYAIYIIFFLQLV